MISNDIEKLALTISGLSDEKKKLEDKLKNTSNTLADYESELAEMLDTQGFKIGSKFTLKNGKTLAIKEFFSASIPSQSAIDKAKDPEKMGDLMERKSSCLKWLDDNKLGDVIKDDVIVSFGRGEHETAKKLMLELQDQDMNFTRNETVHAMTLKATLKEALKAGVNVPFETFSVQTGTTISIK